MSTFMKRMILATVTGLFVISSAPQGAAPPRPLFVPGELIVKLRPEAQVDSAIILAAHGLRIIRTLRGIQALHVALPPNASVERMANALRGLREMEYAEPNYYRYIDAIPNDPRFSELFALDNQGQTGGRIDADIDAPEAWDIALGAAEVVVASIDSGIDLDHEDLAANIYTNPGEIPGNGIDDDDNGFIDDVHGWDFRGNDNDPTDPGGACFGHGTHTAGTAGAVGNNGIGVTGVAQVVRLMPLRAFYSSPPFCTARDADLIEAIQYVGLMKVPISNNSWGSFAENLAMKSAIAASRHLFVASAGNTGSNNDFLSSFPASYALDSIVAVAATDSLDRKASFSNFGSRSVDLAAPGVGILSTLPGDRYGLLDGTSMAAPHVAGAAAVLLGHDPTLTQGEIKARLLRGVDVLGLKVASKGRLNLFRSLTLPPSPVTIKVTPLGSSDINPGDTVPYRLRIENASAAAQQVTASVRIWGPSGQQAFLLGPGPLTVNAGQVMTGDFSVATPATLIPGDYRLIGRVENPTIVYDEDQVIYALR